MTSHPIPARWHRFLDWKPVSVFCIGLLWAVVVSHDFARPSYSNADPDIIYMYQALLINGGLAQEYFDHTGYIYILALSGWTQLLHALGLLGPIRLQAFTTMTPATFETEFHRLVEAGRYLSFGIASGFIVVLWFTVHRLSGHRVIAAVAAVLFAVSPGLITPALIVRPEMLSSLLAFAAFATLVGAAPATGWRGPALVALAAFLAMAAMMTKVQVVAVVLALPVLALAFGRHHPRPAFAWNRPNASWSVALCIFGALAFALPALTMIFGRAAILGKPVYQTAIMVFVAAMVAAYARLYRIDGRTTVVAGSAVLAGWAAAQYLHLITNEILNTAAVATFIEHMTVFTASAGADQIKGGLTGNLKAVLGGSLADTLWTGVARPFEPATALAYPFRAVFWLSLAALIYMLRKGDRRAFFQGGMLIGLAYAIEVYSGLRGWIANYYIYATPWLIAGASVLAAPILATSSAGHPAPQERPRNIAAGVVVVAMAMAIAWSAGRSVQLAFATRTWQDETNICRQRDAYLHRLPRAFSNRCG